ncbi:MAG TPA: PEP-CTERM sorting domain-containing protein [Verrucomicrobiae bacterium]|jgi:hypothetical protein|nr:PEP-CTERM sorting domain-containing protein [Verrucomicrobiae bacterium]
MKKHPQWFASILAVAGSLSLMSSAQAQTNLLSNFQNFNLSATYGQWNPDGSQVIGGGNGYSPTIVSGSTPGSFQVTAEGYGSGAYNFASPINASGANQFELTFTINSLSGPGPFWMNPGVDIADGTHLVHLTGQNTAGGFLDYGNYTTGTYTIYGSLNDQNGGGPLDTSTITAFNLEFDPTSGYTDPYTITYQSLSVANVPEPGMLSLLGMGMAGLWIVRRRNK